MECCWTGALTFKSVCLNTPGRLSVPLYSDEVRIAANNVVIFANMMNTTVRPECVERILMMLFINGDCQRCHSAQIIINIHFDPNATHLLLSKQVTMISLLCSDSRLRLP